MNIDCPHYTACKLDLCLPLQKCMVVLQVRAALLLLNAVMTANTVLMFA